MKLEQEVKGNSVKVIVSEHTHVILQLDDSCTDTRHRPYDEMTRNKFYGDKEYTWKYLVDLKKTSVYFSLSQNKCSTLYFQFKISHFQLVKMSADQYNEETEMCIFEYLKDKYGEKIHIPSHTEVSNVTKIRSQVSDCDFTIECAGKVSIPVHSLVLKTFWPYFKTLTDSDCVEVANKTLKLDFPESWVCNLVRYLYGETLKLNFDQLTGLMLLGELYQLPKLVGLVSCKLLSTPLDDLPLKDLVAGWQRAAQARHEVSKRLLAKSIIAKAKKSSKLVVEEEVISLCDEFTSQEALALFCDVISLVNLKVLD